MRGGGREGIGMEAWYIYHMFIFLFHFLLFHIVTHVSVGRREGMRDEG